MFWNQIICSFWCTYYISCNIFYVVILYNCKCIKLEKWFFWSSEPKQLLYEYNENQNHAAAEFNYLTHMCWIHSTIYFLFYLYTTATLIL